MAWTSGDITFELLDDHTSDPVATINIGTPAGSIQLMGEPEEVGRTLVLHKAHIQSDMGANALGVKRLRTIAQVFMERFDYDALEVEGEIRTTGARPGRRPGRHRFARLSRDPAR